MSSRSQPFVARKIPPSISWGSYTLDLNRGAFLRGSEEIKLRPKSYDTLKYLVLNSGRLIPKAELIAVLWPDAASVSDDSLTHCIRDVRRALGDDGQTFIRTVPGRGYMFAAPDDAEPEPPEVFPTPVRTSRRAIAASVIAIITIAAIGWVWKDRADRGWAQASVARVTQLAAEGKYPEGYTLALQVLRRLPAEPTVMRLMSELSDDLSVSTTPPGAEVSLRRLGSTQVQLVGATPIQHFILARGEFIVSIRKPGYLGFERTISSAYERARPMKTPLEIRVDHQFVEAGKVPKNMAFVPQGDHILHGFSRASDGTVRLGDYAIDKFEVSNRDFKGFVDAGGYNNSALWQPAASPGSLKDKTGMPGPRGWVGGTFPEGRQMHPVTGVTWYEASAYCRAQGKDLPTLFQWEKAARASMHSALGVTFPWGLLDPAVVQARANFDSAGTTPVDSFEFGMSPYGVYNMAGNVAEWVRNPWDDGYTTAGGGWNDPIYQFGAYGSRPAAHSAETLGFRCALAVNPAGGDQGGMSFASNQEKFHYPVSTESEFQASKLRYAYEKTPLHSALLASTETEPWRREEVEFDGYGGERAKAFLYLPKNAAPPYQVIHFLSGSPWWYGAPVTLIVEDKAAMLAPYIRSGRAVFLVVLKGFAGREPVGAYARLEYGSAEHREILKQWTVDMQRSVDYLETRPDIDTKRIAFWTNSQYDYGAVFAAVDNRYSAAIFIGAGLVPRLQHVTPDVNPLHFLPHIHGPKLTIHGLYDDGHPVRTSEPIFQLLREPKQRATFAGGHIPPPEIAVPLINGFLDKTLGTVARKQ